MALSKTVHPHDRTRFLRLGLVILEELTPMLQDILHNEILPNQIFNKVSQQKSLYQKFGVEQTALIQNAQNDGYKEFDITLTYTLLRNLKCLKVTAPTQGWGTSQMPGNGETTLGDDIERIRLIRNKVQGHKAAPALSETEFLEYWSNISDICKRMQALLSKNYVQSLQMAEVRPIDGEMENTLLEKIRNICTAEKSTRELLQNVLQNTAHCVEETVRIEARDPQKNKLAEALTDTSISILNEMMNSITKTTPVSDIELLYKSIEKFIRENKEESSKLASYPIFKELLQNIRRYANLRKNKMKILARFFDFIMRLKKKYGVDLESLQGSILLKLTFSSEKGCDLYIQDYKRGEIGKQILSVLFYPPYLANFDLHAEDLMIYLNDNEVIAEITDADEAMGDVPGPSTAPYFNPRKATENFSRLCQLIMTICSDLFRDILSRYIKPADLRLELDNNRMKLEKIMNAQQKEQIYPSSGTTTLISKDLDISVLYILLRNICKIPKHQNGWGNPPLDTDTSLAACIERIRIQRNLISAHSTIGEIKDTVFQDHWDELKNSILEIEKHLIGGDMYERGVDELLPCDLNPTRAEKYVKEFKNIQGELLIKREQMESFESTLKTAKRHLAVKRARLDDVEEQQASTTSQIKDLQTTLLTSMQGLRNSPSYDISTHARQSIYKG